MTSGIGKPTVVVLASLLSASPAWAETAARACVPVTRENVVGCVVGASAELRREREASLAAAGRRTAAAPWLPSNPTLFVSLSRRGETEGHSSVLNYNATLSQEIEIAGQRTARRRAAESEVAAREQDITATSRRVAADGIAAYFDVLAAREAMAVARRLETTARQIADVTRGRADAGVASPLDAEVADAASLRVTQARLGAERELRTSSARLASLLGRDPMRDPVSATGSLEPLEAAEVLARAANADAVRERPEVRALASDQHAYEARAEVFRRARIPSPTLQLFAQNDGYNERVLGAGLSLPIPLPQPIGRVYVGEIREAEALARQTSARSDALVRELTVDLATAITTYETRRAEAALFTRERVERAERLLSDIGKEMEAGRLSVRDALLAQQQLIDVLRGSIDTRRELCLASVKLALAAGLPIERERR